MTTEIMIRTLYFPNIIQFVTFSKESLEIRTTVPVCLLANGVILVSGYSKCSIIAISASTINYFQSNGFDKAFPEISMLKQSKKQEKPYKYGND